MKRSQLLIVIPTCHGNPESGSRDPRLGFSREWLGRITAEITKATTEPSRIECRRVQLAPSLTWREWLCEGGVMLYTARCSIDRAVSLIHPGHRRAW